MTLKSQYPFNFHFLVSLDMCDHQEACKYNYQENTTKGGVLLYSFPFFIVHHKIYSQEHMLVAAIRPSVKVLLATYSSGSLSYTSQMSTNVITIIVVCFSQLSVYQN